MKLKAIIILFHGVVWYNHEKMYLIIFSLTFPRGVTCSKFLYHVFYTTLHHTTPSSKPTLTNRAFIKERQINNRFIDLFKKIQKEIPGHLI